MTDDDEFNDAFEDLVDLGEIEPTGTGPNGRVQYRLTEKALHQPAGPQPGKGIRTGSNDRIEIALTPDEFDLIFNHVDLQTERLRVEMLACHSESRTTLHLTLIDLEDLMVFISAAIRRLKNRKLRVALTRLWDRLTEINSRYDVIFADDMTFMSNWPKQQ